MEVPVSFEWVTNEGDKIFAQKWLVEEKNEAVIVMVHGLGEHIGRYAHVANFFNQNNISFYGFDQRGHGKSSGKRGHIGKSQFFIDDIDKMIEIARKEHPETPIFLYGHSLGGNMVLYYSLIVKPDLKGIICTSPGLGTGEPVPPLKLFAAKVLKSLLPSMTMDNGLDVENLSHNPQVIKAYKEDPLVHSMVSTKLAMDMFANGDWVIENANNFPKPLLLLQGSEDHIVNLEKTKEFAENVPAALLTFKIYIGLYHELHNEIVQLEVLTFILNWLNSQ
ncbi:MAG: lysophospholipase [Anaerolineaceae bacterium]|nr:lysophospholipase [Anaerolineaceae bacterium]